MPCSGFPDARAILAKGKQSQNVTESWSMKDVRKSARQCGVERQDDEFRSTSPTGVEVTRVDLSARCVSGRVYSSA